MSRSEYERAWGTAGWLDDHEFMGDGTTKACQRKTKPRGIVDRVAGRYDVVNVKAVYRKVFAGGDELCAVFLWGADAPSARDQTDVFGRLHCVIRDLRWDAEVDCAHLTTFLYDVPSGHWRALVVFKRRAK